MNGQDGISRGRQSQILGASASREKGRSVVVTSHGKPVAKIMPIVEDERAAEVARSTLFARLRRERVVKAGRWTRDELYDDAR